MEHAKEIIESKCMGGGVTEDEGVNIYKWVKKTAKIKGSIVEVGCSRGSTASIIAKKDG